MLVLIVFVILFTQSFGRLTVVNTLSGWGYDVFMMGLRLSLSDIVVRLP